MLITGEINGQESRQLRCVDLLGSTGETQAERALPEAASSGTAATPSPPEDLRN